MIGRLRAWAHGKLGGARLEFRGAGGFLLASDDPTIMCVVGPGALPPDVESTLADAAVRRALLSPPVVPVAGSPCVLVYASGTVSMDPRAVRVTPELVPLWRRALRRAVRHVTRSVDDD